MLTAVLWEEEKVGLIISLEMIRCMAYKKIVERISYWRCKCIQMNTLHFWLAEKLSNGRDIKYLFCSKNVNKHVNLRFLAVNPAG